MDTPAPTEVGPRGEPQRTAGTPGPSGAVGFRRMFLLAGLAGLGLAALAVLSLWLHFRNTPDFRAALALHPVADPAAAAGWPAAPWTSPEGTWQLGDPDPFAEAPLDGSLRIDRFRLITTVSHGDQTLARVRHEVAIAVEVASETRRSLAVRSAVLDQAPEVGIRARVWVEGEPLVGTGSDLRGELTFDVVVHAGAATPRCDVAGAPAEGLPELPEERSSGLAGALSDWIHPAGPADPSGVVHVVRRKVFLTEKTTAGGRQGISHSETGHVPSTREYSFSVESALESNSTRTTHTQSLTRTWNGRVW
ncbi:MAG: hypothetical protein IPK67_09815 [Planctomycetes bacterium]|nr:hypothetical protein [Planctomycetota bacterium]